MAKKPEVKKTTPKAATKAANKATSTKKATKKSATVKATAKPEAKKPVTKKTVTKKTETKKPAAKKAATKSVAKKEVTEKKAAAKPAVKKAVAKKPAAKKAAGKKAAPEKPVVKMRLVARKTSRKKFAPAANTLEAKSEQFTASAVKEAANAPKAANTPKKAPVKVKIEFSTDEFVVYPTHGVGKITGIEEQEVSGMKLQVFVIDFAQDKMTLRVPIGKAKTSGMRRLSTTKEMEQALTTLKGRARVKRTMWSRRAQEYEAKINSGDPILIAEVVRDLHRSSNQPDQSYSERQIYEAALGRLARELAAVEKTDEESATEKLEGVLQAA